MLEAHGEQGKKVGVGGCEELFERHSETLDKSREKIKRDDEEGFVGLIQLRVLLVLLVLE